MNLNIKIYFYSFKPGIFIQQAVDFLANESWIQCKIKIRTNEPKNRKNTEAQPKLTGSYKKKCNRHQFHGSHFNKNFSEKDISLQCNGFNEKWLLGYDEDKDEDASENDENN